MPDETQSTPSPKRKRRWYQLSLRTFLVAVLVLGTWLGVHVDRTLKQRDAAILIIKHNGAVYYRFEIDSDGYRINQIPGPYPKWLVSLIGIDSLATISSVCLDTEIPDLDVLTRLPAIRHLELNNVREIDVSVLKSLRQLTHLTIEVSPEFDPNQLNELANLRYLGFYTEQSCYRDDISFLAPLHELEMLKIEVNGSADLTPIVNLPKLKVLWIWGASEGELSELFRQLPSVKIWGESDEGKSLFHNPTTQIKTR